MLIDTMNIAKMINNSAIVNSTLAEEISQFPKRVPIDSAHWIQTRSTDSEYPQLSASEMAAQYAPASVSFITLAFIVGLFCMYFLLCKWAMKGKFDLPDRDGELKQSAPLKFRNPFSSKAKIPAIRSSENEMNQRVPTISQDG